MSGFRCEHGHPSPHFKQKNILLQKVMGNVAYLKLHPAANTPEGLPSKEMLW